MGDLPVVMYTITQFVFDYMYEYMYMYSLSCDHAPSKSNVPRVLKANTVLVTSRDSNSE